MVSEKQVNFYRKWENWILPLLFTLALLLFTSLRFDYYYSLNDDVLMKDILAGVYTGVPESRNVQMLYPLSLLLSLLVKVFHTSYVYGIFLCLCQFGSLYLILYRSMRYGKKTVGKVLLCLLESLLFAGLLLPHLVFVQYTVTSGLLGAAGIFWFLTGEAAACPGMQARSGKENGWGCFVKRNLPAVLLCVLAFLLRPEMMMLLLPLASVAGLWKWGMERPVFTRYNAFCYVGVFSLILIGLLLGEVSNTAAYGSGEWKEFFRLFDARTEVYDFKTETILKFEENQEFYTSLGLDETQGALLENYNYGIDDSIDAALMEKISGYSREKEGYFGKTLKEGIWLYKARLQNMPGLDFDAAVEMPFLLTEAALAVLLLLTAFLKRRAGVIWQLLAFGGVRSILWMYLILRNRVPERISHPLYTVEIVMLAALLFMYLTKNGAADEAAQEELEKVHNPYRWLNPVFVTAALLLVTALSILPRTFARTVQEYAAREEINRTDIASRAYYQSHPENLFLADVYSTVKFSEKMFRDGECVLGNYDLLGGWLCKSPLAEKKLKAFGYASLGQALLEGENVYLVAETGQSLDWLTDYFGRRGTVLRAEPKEVIGAADSGLVIYSLHREEEVND